MAEITSRFFGSRDRNRIYERRRAGGLQPPRGFDLRRERSAANGVSTFCVSLRFLRQLEFAAAASRRHGAR
jgi:hypothetical protein